MGSPITFSGFNDIDFNAVVTALMAQASQPLNALQNRQKSLQSQISSFDKLGTHVAALRSAADAIGGPASLAMVSGTSSNAAAVAISAKTTASPGAYDVVVNEIARAQVTVSNSTAPDANTTIVASGGTITIGATAVAISGDVTLQQLAAAINGTDGIGVTATVVRTGATAYKLALSAKDTGVANAFTITNGLTGGTGLTFTDTDTNGVSGDSAADNAVTATDASILLNNIPVTGSSNVFEEIVTGVTITAIKKDPAATVRVDVARDTTVVKENIGSFVSAYNEFVKFLQEQRTAAAGGDAASLGREPILRQLHGGMRSMLMAMHGTGTLTRLAEVGVEMTTTGQLKLVESRLDEAVASDPDAVRELFGGTAGAFPAMEAMLDAYQQADGFIPAGKQRLQKQIESMNDQIEAMQRRLALQKETLQRQFAEADLMMSRLKAQATSLSNFGSSLGGA